MMPDFKEGICGAVQCGIYRLELLFPKTKQCILQRYSVPHDLRKWKTAIRDFQSNHLYLNNFCKGLRIRTSVRVISIFD